MHEIYFKADKDYKGRYSVPVLWDKKLNTIVNNESHELLRDLQTAFNDLLPNDVANLTLYPEELQNDIDRIAEWMQADLNTGVYKAGFAPNQEIYNQKVPGPFACLNKLEAIAHSNGGPYLLGKKMTEIDVRAYATLIRFDPVYVQHFKCNLGMIRYNYPVLNNWLKHMYWHHEAFKSTTDFRQIKENYTKSHYDVNPKAITPLGPYPDIEGHYESDWSKLKPGRIDMPEVVEWEEKLP
ncbi:glutathione S-transferase omega-like 2 [Hortaea werneckii]|nr:glutathione S-transferase omega-like 2 [Hortaea werneckii]KAI7546693.1 glutathione S-transferase omega-like 2 [Hortaea werneckii]